MSDEAKHIWFGFLIATVFYIVLSFLVIDKIITGWQYLAVTHHAAEFYLDENHERQWRWLDEKK